MRAKTGKPRGKPFEKGDPRAGRPKGVLNKVTLEIREVARSLVEDDGYRRRFKERLYEGSMAPALEALVWHYAYGKPKETHEHTGADGGPIETVSRIEWALVDGKNAKN